MNDCHLDNHKTEMVQHQAARFVTKNYRHASIVTSMMHQLGWDTLQRHREVARLTDDDVQNSAPADRQLDTPTKPYLTPSTTRTRSHDTPIRQIQMLFGGHENNFFPKTIML